MTKENSFSDLFNVTTEGNDVSPVELTSPYLEPFSDLSAFTIIQRDEAIHRHNIIKFLIKEGVNAFTEKQLTPLLSALVTEFGSPAPNVRTLARWWSLFKSSNFNIVSLVPTIQAGNKKSKIVPELEPLISKTIDRLMSAERPNLAEGYRYLEDLVFRHNKENKLQLNCISSEALRLRVSKITPFEKFKAKKGLTAAKFEFKSIGKKIATSRVLERVEADHTRFDLFVVDDIYQVPMGRPWLTLLIDSLSLSVVGFYLGFEPPSFVSICHAIKNAILPKEYVKTSYPSIKTEWLCSGLIETLVTDNGKEFDDKDFKQTCYELGINVAKNPTKKPHLKSSIERYFGALNTQLLASPPGKTFSNIIAREDYDPEKNAVISLSDIQLVVHKWIIEIYQAQPNSRWSNMPNLSWLTAAKAFPPQPYRGPIDALDFKLGRTFFPMLRREGITKDKLRYHNDRLAMYRGKFGDHKVIAKQDPNNIGRIVVCDVDLKEFFIVPAVDLEYADGLSLWQHRLNCQYARKYIEKNYNHQDVLKARSEINDIVTESMSKMVNTKKVSLKVTDRVRTGRYLEVERKRVAGKTKQSVAKKKISNAKKQVSSEVWELDTNTSDWSVSRVRK